MKWNPRMIAAARAERGWSQDDLARRMRIASGRQTVSYWERGGSVSVRRLVELCGVFEKPPTFFFTGEGHE